MRPLTDQDEQIQITKSGGFWLDLYTVKSYNKLGHRDIRNQII